MTLPANAELAQILSAAQWEAMAEGQSEIGSAHLLLGVFHLPECQAVRTLRALGVEPRWERLRKAPLPDWPPPVAVPAMTPHLSAEGERVMHLASDEAQNERIGAEHLVVGLLRETRGVGGMLLRLHGLTVKKRGVLCVPVRTTRESYRRSWSR